LELGGCTKVQNKIPSICIKLFACEAAQKLFDEAKCRKTLNKIECPDKTIGAFFNPKPLKNECKLLHHLKKRRT